MNRMRTALYTLALAALPLIAQPQSEEQPMRLGDVLGLLIGAYNGAAEAAEQGGHPLFAERLSEADTARLKRGLNQLQNELQGLVKDDGTLDSQRAAQLLNALQQLQGGETRFDFVKAEAALDRARKREDGALLDQFLNILASGGGAALTADVNQFKRLAAEQIGGPHAVETLVDLLKIIYADRELGSVNPAREQQAHALIAQTVQSGAVSTAHFEEIRKLLGAIGGPFKDDYKHWNKARDTLLRPAVDTGEINSIIKALQNKNLTPEQREQILRALR